MNSVQVYRSKYRSNYNDKYIQKNLDTLNLLPHNCLSKLIFLQGYVHISLLVVTPKKYSKSGLFHDREPIIVFLHKTYCLLALDSSLVFNSLRRL